MTEVRATPDGPMVAQYAADLAIAQSLARASRSPATLRVYRGCWRRWTAYAEACGLPAYPAPAEGIAAWLASLAASGKCHSTVVQHRAAVAAAHRMAGFSDPTDHAAVAAVVDGIARTYGIAPRRQAPAVTPAVIHAMLATCDQTAIGLRDAALIALWWAAALRASEPAQLRLGDVRWTDEGAVVFLRRSKTDQTGRGTTIPIRRGIETQRLQRWHDLACADWLRRGNKAHDGPLFFDLRTGAGLSAGACGALVQRRARLAGVQLTGHSLRAGWATEAARRGVAFLLIQRHLRHAAASTTARYVRRGQLWEDAAPVLLEATPCSTTT